MKFFDRIANHAFMTGRGVGWAAIPFIVAVYTAFKSVSASIVGNQLVTDYKQSDVYPDREVRLHYIASSSREQFREL